MFGQGKHPEQLLSFGLNGVMTTKVDLGEVFEFFTFEDLDYAGATFKNYLTINYSKWVNKKQQDAKKKVDVDDLDESCRRYPFRYLTMDQWNSMMNKFLTLNFKEKVKKNSSNRNKNDEYLIYKGGSTSFEPNTQTLSRKLGCEASFSKFFCQHICR